MKAITRIFAVLVITGAIGLASARADDDPIPTPTEVADRDVNNDPVVGVSPTPYVKQWTWMATANEIHYVERTFIGSNGFGINYYRVTVNIVLAGDLIYSDSYTVMAANPHGEGENQY